MGSGTLTIFSASAGSGKTYRLTGIYLIKLFSSKFSYRKILAVTFTNKATAEMKNRILDQLYGLATGKHSAYLTEIIESTGKNEITIRSEAKVILDSILNDYSSFYVSTIDSFFQKILRSFTREIGLHSGFSIEIDHSTILSEAVDNLISSVSEDEALRKWLTDYARSNIGEGKNWNMKIEIIKMAEELFKEKFKLFSADSRLKLDDKESLMTYLGEMVLISSSFEMSLKEFGRKCEEICTLYSLSDDMFYQKGKGIPSFIKSLIRGEDRIPNSYVREIMNDPPRWCTGKMSVELQAAIEAGFETILRDAITLFDNNIRNYKTANVIRSSIFALGILSDVLGKIHLITSEENSFLLSEAGELIYLLIAKDQTPFIYEKVGNRFENFMIDEFQDTSIIQWNNFRLLIENSMAGGGDNIVVGDIKQSIYRWRNSDWSILNGLLNHVDDDRIKSVALKTNWRSRTNIIKFNNALFSIIPEQLDEEFGSENLPVSFKELYAEAVQEDPGEKGEGYIRLEFIKDNDGDKWKEIVIKRLPTVIEQFEDKGYLASDIGILVRDNRDGALVLKTMIDYNNNCSLAKKQIYNYEIVSNDSLLLSQSYVISFIISALLVLNNKEDMINKARMLRFYLLASGKEGADKVLLIFNKLSDESTKHFPDGYADFLDRTKQLPLFEVTESIIKFFGLGNYSWNVAWLNTFQDWVLAFSGNKSTGIQSFLDWWETDGKRKSVVLPEQQNAIKVLTIHKSKGLEFKVVIIPFLSWETDHKPNHHPILWIKPDVSPFDNISIVPVKYKKELEETIFAKEYKIERFSSVTDNINLLYVAVTRSIDALFCFLPDDEKAENNIAGVIKKAVSLKINAKEGIQLSDHFNIEEGYFEFGKIPDIRRDSFEDHSITSFKYCVKQDLESLKLKLHGENYLSPENSGVKERINYGRLMHEVFENIITGDDITAAIRKMINDGKITENESVEFEKRISLLINSPQVRDWFHPDNKVMTETGILMPSGVLKRPDRVIFKDGKTIIIDFKFGVESSHYLDQIGQYRRLIDEMGFNEIEAYIWYVDKNKIVTA